MAERRHDRIASRPGVMAGKPCVAGTRIPVYLVLQALAAERGFAGVREAYPSLTDEDIAAALDFAADWLEDEQVIFADSAVSAPATTTA